MALKIRRDTLALISVASLMATSASAEVISLPRKSGAVHTEFKNLLNAQIRQFQNGIGRISIVGESSRNNRCDISFYTNTDTTFVTLAEKGGDFYNEFYIDHPSQSFRPILFQNLIKKEDSTKLSVEQRNGSYAIESKGAELIVSNKNDQGKKTSCSFSISAANFYEGETE